MDIPLESIQPANAHAFQALPIPVRSFTGAGIAYYRVYDGGQCKEVEAETAAEAMKASGLALAQRIEREIRSNELLVDLKKLLGDRAKAIADAPPAADAAPVTPATADAPVDVPPAA